VVNWQLSQEEKNKQILERQYVDALKEDLTELGQGQKQVAQQKLQLNQEQEQKRKARYPEPIKGLVDLFGPESVKGQAVSAGQPKLTPLEYKKIADKHRPKPTVLKNSLWAFGVGGLICAIGQVIQNGLAVFGIAPDGMSSVTSIIMIFLGAFLTGLGVYDEIGKRAGAGSIVPVTGFANSMVAPAMEFKREGTVFGVGAKLFTIAGPVLVYGILTSFTVGLIKFLLH